MDDKSPGSASAANDLAPRGAKELWPVSSSDWSDEDLSPPARLVKIPCKLMFGILLEDLGLPDARYSSHTHDDGEISAVVTFYGPSEIPGKLLQQFKIGGAPAANSEEAEDSAAKEGIRHIGMSQNTEIEDLHYSELKCVMKKFKSLLYKATKEQKEKQKLQAELALAGKKMLRFSRDMSSLVCANYCMGQGSEVETFNEGLEKFENMATDLSKAARNVGRKLKKHKKPELLRR